MNSSDNTSVSFACTACGKCCNSGPALSLAEAFKHQQLFITGLRFRAECFSNMSLSSVEIGGHRLTRGQTDELRAHLKAICPELKTPQGTYYLEIYPSVTGYSLVTGNSCEALGDDNMCSLEANKPSMCRSVPFDTILPQSLQAIALDAFTAYGCASTNPASTDERPVIFRDRSIVDHEYAAAYERRLQDWRDDSESFAMLTSLMLEGMGMLPDLEMLMSSRGWVETSMMPILIALATKDQESKEKVLGFVDVQTKLITEEMAKAVARKNKAEVPRSRILKTYLSDYALLAETLPDLKPLAAN